MLAFKKNLRIKAKIEDYLTVVNQVLDQYLESIEYYLENHLNDHFNTCVKLTHGFESKADDLRREIETELFGKSLLPEVREDIIQIIDLMDKIPGMCERVLRSIYTQNIVLPNEFDDRVKELVELGVACCRPLKEAVMDVLGPCEKIKEITRTIDTNESVADKLEWEIIHDIFHGDFEPFDRIMYRDVVLWIASLPDLAERICDQLTIFAIKRTV
jgi:predicted phosphate transport protein (TIGR00153 family)